jgi:signal transduction histidine kinase
VPSSTEAAQIAAERETLRRVTGLVARGAPQDEVFAAVAAELAQLVRADATALLRFEPDDTVTPVASWSRDGSGVLVGERPPVGSALHRLREDCRTVRFGPDELWGSGPFVDATQLEIRTAVAVPITVDGEIWGASFVAAIGDKPFGDDTETRIAGFTELVTAVIANAQARLELRSLIEEQTALRRVTALVASEAPEDELFHAVAVQAARVVDGQPIVVLRFEPQGGATLVGVHGLATPPGAEIAVRAVAGAPIVVRGRTWGLISTIPGTGALSAETEGRLAQFAELVATAIENAESRAALTASRARVVAAADESRRRIQRDLHDGAQQRLSCTVITLKLLKAAVGDHDARHDALVAEALEHAEGATVELRELVQGIVPAALGRGGLCGGVQSLLDRIDLPAFVDIDPGRLPQAVETAAYFVIAEALTNAVKHSRAESVHVRAAVVDGALELEVRDDGVGGADNRRGTGLVGLEDRVAAIGGALAVTSPPGRGTAVTAVLPMGARSPVLAGA